MNRMRANASGEDGFTLIELLIVIVILGILAGIAIFAVGAFQKDATTACTNANKRIDATVSAAKKVNPDGTYTTTAGKCT
jgi:prepilin-type N-terminal cleavage/methylation domain-containing protein